MRILLINPPYRTLTSTVGVGHQVPLGLIAVGGPLIDAGHTVRLLDAECLRLDDERIVEAVRAAAPDVVMTGHAGSTPAHPVCIRMLRAIRHALPSVTTVYGGVFPTYHASAILAAEDAVDFIVRGEGEATALDLITALASDADDDALADVTGVSRRANGRIVTNPDRPPLRDLDAVRRGWELVEDWDRYRCFGLGRAAVVQFSRGCPHRCTYCGQHDFWMRWRHRDPVAFVDEVEFLYREHDVRFLTLADENPTTLPRVWRRVLEELAARALPVRIFATIRATDIVRDEAILPLYRDAGILYVLMGIESTDAAVLAQVRKRSTPREDFRACQLLKAHGIFSVIGHIVGLGDERWSSLWRAARVLAAYDGDYLNAMYVTPHTWTPFAAAQSARPLVELDQGRWDYRHQVLAEPHLRPWQLFLGVKCLELHFHLRPRRLWRLFTADAFRRRQALWCQAHTFAVWLGEIASFLTSRRASGARTL
ncbi:MAG: cobalamin-dependent protein, partial [Phycisphaerales bacterium]|nr:cobalamin-dependent protein [Phycisphaerales bacterium]